MQQRVMSGLPDSEAEDRERLEQFLAWRRATGRGPRRSVTAVGLRWFAYGAGVGVLGVVFVALASLLTADLRRGGQRLDPAPSPGPTASVQEPAPAAEQRGAPDADSGPSGAARAIVEADPGASDRVLALALPDRPSLPERPSLPDRSSRLERSPLLDRPSRSVRSIERPYVASDPVGLPERPTLSGQASLSRLPSVEFVRESPDVTPPAASPPREPGASDSPEPAVAPSRPLPPGPGAHEHDRDGTTRSTPVGHTSRRITAVARSPESAARSSQVVTVEGVLPGAAPPSAPAASASSAPTGSASRSSVVQPPEVAVKPLPEPIETVKRFVESIPTEKVGKTVRRWMTRDRDQEPPPVPPLDR
jgi:hypothetical protein